MISKVIEYWNLFPSRVNIYMTKIKNGREERKRKA